MRAVSALLAAALLSGCGSTVALTGTATQDGLAGGGLEQPGTVTTTGPEGSSTVVPGQTTQTTTSTPNLPGRVTGPSTGSTAAPRTTTVAGPTARVTGPLEVGFMTTTVGNAQSAGVNVGQTYSDKAAYDALVAEYNLAGGLAGRRIVPVYGATDTASTNWSTDFQAACQKMTDDHKVKAVLGYVFAFIDSFEQCIAKKDVLHLYGGYGPGDLQAQKDFPNLVSAVHPTTDVINSTVLTGAMASGRLTTKSRLGILYDGCGHGDRAFDRSTAPFLKANGITYEKVYGACAQGSGDVSSALTTVQSAQLQFASHGVDVVYVPNNVALLFFMQAAENQGYRPQYLTQGGGGALEAQGGAIPQAQLKNLHGYGWMPAIDVSAQQQPYARTPRQQACLAKLEKHGLVASQFNDFMFAYVTCDSLDLYARALQLTGGDADRAKVQAALAQVLPALDGTATYSGALTSTTAQRGGPGKYRESGWSDACSCITYRGPVRAVPGV